VDEPLHAMAWICGACVIDGAALLNADLRSSIARAVA
jgi:hypothetical protein